MAVMNALCTNYGEEKLPDTRKTAAGSDQGNCLMLEFRRLRMVLPNKDSLALKFLRIESL